MTASTVVQWLDAITFPLGLACVTASVACAQPPDAGSGARESAREAPAPDARAPDQGGRRLYVDPETGERTAPPPGAAAEPPHPSLDTSTEGLVERPLPGGGVGVDLKGRFRQRREGDAPEAAPEANGAGADARRPPTP